ncbi:transposase [Streptomyces sp. NA02950]|nr:transposase [Streptomyces sp. NA02950]
MSDDELSSRIEPLLPVPQQRYRRPGRKKVLEDRNVLCGILFVLYSGIQWEWLPSELRFGSGMTCWRRLRDRNGAGVWQRLHEVLLAELRATGRLDLSRVALVLRISREPGHGPQSPSPDLRARPAPTASARAVVHRGRAFRG